MQTLTSRDCCIIADRWYEQAKAEIEKTGRFEEFLEYSDRGDGEVHSFGLSDTLSYSGSDTKRATRGEWKVLAEELSVHIDLQLSREGLCVTKYSDEYIELAKLFYDRVLYLESICLSRYKRDWSFEPFTRLIARESLSVESHHKQAIAGKQKNYTSINNIYEQYRNSEILVHKDNKSRLKTLDEVKHKLSRFIEIVGDKDISQISKSDIIQYKDTLLQLPKSKDISIRSKTIDEKISIAKEQQLVLLSSTTVNNSIKQLSLVFSYAVEIGLIDNNPTFGIRVKHSNKKIEVSDIGRGYSSQDVSKLFDDDLFHVSSNKHTYGLACYWIPLLCRYTGSRLNEMAQLNSSDVSKSDDGIHFINIRRGEGQSVKTDSSLRHIPIPEHLIELGFLDFVGSSNGNLFPLIPVNKYGARSQAISRWWSKYVKSKDIVISEPVHAVMV